MTSLDPPVQDPPKSLIPSTSDKAALLAGTPLAIVSVMVYQDLSGHTLDALQAVAIGAVGATMIGYFWHVITVLIDRAINR